MIENIMESLLFGKRASEILHQAHADGCIHLSQCMLDIDLLVIAGLGSDGFVEWIDDDLFLTEKGKEMAQICFNEINSQQV